MNFEEAFLDAFRDEISLLTKSAGVPKGMPLRKEPFWFRKGSSRFIGQEDPRETYTRERQLAHEEGKIKGKADPESPEGVWTFGKLHKEKARGALSSASRFANDPVGRAQQRREFFVKGLSTPHEALKGFPKSSVSKARARAEEQKKKVEGPVRGWEKKDK